MMGTVNLPTPGQRIEEAEAELETLRARIAELEKQRDGLAKDAEIYRWLRDNSRSWSWNPSQYNKEIISGFAAFNAGYLGFAFESAVLAALASVLEGAVK